MLEINKNDKILYSSKWMEVKLKDNWYVYNHSPWNKGIGVAVLAYRRKGNGYMYVGRYETTPCHSPEPKLCSITGGYDNAHKFSIVECALNELKEEGGYIAPPEAVKSLGNVFPSKGSDTVMCLFLVDLDHPDVKQCFASGDGTFGEHGSYAKWVSEEDLINASDPLNHTMLLRFKQKGE